MIRTDELELVGPTASFVPFLVFMRCLAMHIEPTAFVANAILSCLDGSAAVLTLYHHDGQAVLDIVWPRGPHAIGRTNTRHDLGAGRAGVDALQSILGGTPAVEPFMMNAAVESLEPYVLCLAPHREDLAALLSDEDPLVRDIARLHVEHAL